MHRIPGTAVRVQVGITDEVELERTHSRIAVKRVLRVYRRSMLLALVLSRSTLPNVNLTVCVHYAVPRV